ncbi:hypothetical protein EZS27_021534 [termite gut metagenome]|uniref:Uncharacterized protein n=1 Tax=termite gut metagenome TaxID=433724 RepID=A0A5J4R6Q9_9ZZZZ
MTSQEEYADKVRKYKQMDEHARRHHENIINSFAPYTVEEKIYILCHLYDHLRKDIAAISGGKK